MLVYLASGLFQAMLRVCRGKWAAVSRESKRSCRSPVGRLIGPSAPESAQNPLLTRGLCHDTFGRTRCVVTLAHRDEIEAMLRNGVLALIAAPGFDWLEVVADC